MPSKTNRLSRFFKSWPSEGMGPFESFLCTALFFVAPFEAYLVSTVGGVVKYVLLFTILLILYKDIYTKRTVQLNWFVTFFVFWLAYKIVSILWTIDLTIPLLHFASQLGMVGFLFVLSSTDIGERQRSIVLGGYFWGSVAFCLLSLVFMEPSGTYTQRFVLTLFGVQVDPNNAAASALPAFALGVYHCTRVRRMPTKCIYGVLAAIAAYVLLMTGSRGGMLAVAASAAVLVFFSTDLKLYQKAAVAVLLVVGCVFVLGLLPQDTYARLFQDDYTDGSGRTELWGVVWEAFLTNPIFGVGWGAATSLNEGMATHNTFLSMLCEQGMFGTFFFVAPIIYVAVVSFRSKNVLPIILLVCAIVPALTIDAINKRFVWYGITLALVYFGTIDGERASLERRGR